VVKLMVAVLALALTVMSASVKAQMYDPRYPVCMHVYGLQTGERMDCDFTTIAQCQASASARGATCDINPYFVRTPNVVRAPRPWRR